MFEGCLKICSPNTLENEHKTCIFMIVCVATLNIFWGKIFLPKENWANCPSEGICPSEGLLSLYENSFLFPSEWTIFPGHEGFGKKGVFPA